MRQPPARSEPPDGLPGGVVELAVERWQWADRLAGHAGLRPFELGAQGWRDRVVDELTAPTRLEDWPDPAEPRPVAGGWIHDEVVDEDRQPFEEFAAARPGAGPESLAELAQELRWPVTPYRRLSCRSTAVPSGSGARTARDTSRSSDGGDGRGGGDRAGRPRVLDLTTHWAGPLATMLLAEAGAEVTKLDPTSRPDGFRDRPGLYRHLNAHKDVVDLDLRRQQDRDRFEAMIVDADLLIDSFSRRVLPNLGYGRTELSRLNPELATLSIKAFPATSPEADWLAFGPGVHAASGLGFASPTDSEAPAPAPIAYPDLVAGITAYAAATSLLTRPVEPAQRGEGAPAVEVSLAGSIAPLIRLAIEANESASPEASARG